MNAARLYKPPFERTAADAARDARLKADIARFREAARGDEPGEERVGLAGAKGALVYVLLLDLVLLVAALCGSFSASSRATTSRQPGRARR